MPEVRIAMDPMNPGQFFACCGLWELFDLLGATALAHFEVDERRPRQAQFVLQSDGELSLAAAVGALRAAKVEPIMHAEAKIAPIRIVVGGAALELDWWLDRFREKAERLKCWAARQTSLSIASELLRLLPADADERLLNYAAMTTTRFGVDPRSAWNSKDVGYSPNEHQQESASFPAVEMPAAVGLSGFRPGKRQRKSAGNFREWEYVYALWPEPLPRAVGRLACCAPWDGLGAVGYRFQLGKRGSFKFFQFSQAQERSDRRS
jgi:CRISPR-associated protein Csx14